jgi:hypothetical protein
MINQTTPSIFSMDSAQDRLSEKDLKFLQMRQNFLKPSNYIGFSFLVFLAVIFLWLFLKAPNLINPFEVERQIAANTLSASTIKVMATLLPLMVMIAFFLTVSIILFGFWAFANEKTYLKIIETLMTGTQGGGKGVPSSQKDFKGSKKKNSGGKKNNPD